MNVYLLQMILGNGNMVALDLVKFAVLGIRLESNFLYPFSCKLLFPGFWSKFLLNWV